MQNPIDAHARIDRVLLILYGFAFVVMAALGYFIYSVSGTLTVLKNEIASSTHITNQRITGLETFLASTSDQFSQQLLAQQSQSDSFQQTLGTLEKLSKTDRELLQKYSKVYFLSDNYIPMSLSILDKKYGYDQTKTLQFHSLALPYLIRMLEQAHYEGVSLKVSSAYRSFGDQSTLKSNYSVTYGSGANQFSADQGYSEHQLGTAVDLTTDGMKQVLDISFENTPAYIWLTKYAYRYGFVLSYPKNNAYYQYEPWHWRFVGVELAIKMYNEKLNFSDMDQRIIDTFLVKIFD